jgi:hypothetical protein
MVRITLIGITILAAFVLGAWVVHKFYQNEREETTQANSTVLLEKVEKVLKLVTVEGNFSELYDETNIRKFTVYMPLPSSWTFSKKAILKVEGKVLVGYNMENIVISADSANRRIILSNLPEPEVLAIDHQVKYENIEESWFNSFSEEDYTNLNRNAKEVLRQKALESRLLDEARNQGNQLIEVIRFMVESSGWELIYQDQFRILPIDSLLH